MDEKETKRSVPETDGQNPAPRESLSMDSIEAPVDVFYGKLAQGADLPFVAQSTGKYREGRGFSYYREGFDAYCFFVTVSGTGEITYRGETKRVERGDMVFVSSVLGDPVPPLRPYNPAAEYYFSDLKLEGEAKAGKEVELSATLHNDSATDRVFKLALSHPLLSVSCAEAAQASPSRRVRQSPSPSS